MSVNPYQTPESSPIHEIGGSLGIGRFGAMTSTFRIAWVCVLLLVVNIVTIILGFVIDKYTVVEIAPSQTLGIIIYVATIISVCMWTSKSMINAWALGEVRPTITPGWAAGWYFIPIAWFWKPYQALKEIWENLYGKETSKALPIVWWICWSLNFIAQILSAYIFYHFNMIDEYKVITSVAIGWKIMGILAAVFLILVILRITRGHQERINRKTNFSYGR